MESLGLLGAQSGFKEKSPILTALLVFQKTSKKNLLSNSLSLRTVVFGLRQLIQTNVHGFFIPVMVVGVEGNVVSAFYVLICDCDI